MLVDVVLMRRDGVKLPEAEIRAAKPMRGWLVMLTLRRQAGAAPGQPASSTEVSLLPSQDSVLDCLASMRNARVLRIRDGSLVIVGTEHRGPPMQGTDVPQAWWCRLAHDSRQD